jgi:sulfopyruvate decarboxylase TPP-binding subunit
MTERWHERVVKVLEANEVRLVTYIPDNVLTALIQAVHADPWFRAICPARVLQTLGIEHFAVERLEDVEFVLDGMIKQAYATQAPAALILSPLLTRKPA